MGDAEAVAAMRRDERFTGTPAIVVDMHQEGLLTTINGWKASEGGDVSHRGFTDCCCLLLFLLTICFSGFELWHGYRHGDVAKLVHGISWDGTICGGDKHLLYWCKQGAGWTNLSDGICVSECPTRNDTSHLCPDPPVAHTVNKTVPGGFTVQVTVDRSLTPRPDYPTVATVGMYCLPRSSEDGAEAVFLQSGLDGWTSAVVLSLKGVYAHTEDLARVALLQMILCFVFVFALSRCLMITLVLVLAVEIAGLATLTLWLGSQSAIPSDPVFLLDPYDPNFKKYWTVLACGASAFSLVAFASFVGSFLKSARKVREPIYEASRVISSVPSVLISPVIQVLVKLAFVVVGLVGLALLVSLGDVEGPSVAGLHVGPRVSALEVSGVGRYLRLSRPRIRM